MPESKKNDLLISYLPEETDPDTVDVMLITGDVYIDHPSFGVAVIARVLYHAGYSICIVSQPHYYDKSYLDKLPDVRLFIGITSGNMDSVVGNFTGNRNNRKDNSYSINGESLFNNGQKRRPDRALIVYTPFIKQRYKDIPIVIGGLEASLRRFTHYDFVQNKIRRSVLTDSKADILVYGMGEKPIIEIAAAIKTSQKPYGIKGTMVRVTNNAIPENSIILPDYNTLTTDRRRLIETVTIVESNMTPGKSKPIYQDQGGTGVIAFTPQELMTTEEIDSIYDLPFKRSYPEYCKDIPAWNMINTSITSHRGCYGRCSFCAIAIHQGAQIVQRSKISIIKEAVSITEDPAFKGTISDVGGPTANMYGTSCKIGWCSDPHCLFPDICTNLILDKNTYVDILKAIKSLKKVKHIFVSSGIRHDLALIKPEETEWIILNTTSGHFKIAPEHIDNSILKLMKKPPVEKLINFIELFEKVKKKHSLNYYLLPYLILSHPGSSSDSAERLAAFLIKYDLRTRQYQDFTPVPSTLSTAMYYSGTDLDGSKINIPPVSSINNTQRDILEKALKKIRK